jgi:ATP-dependent 26S proteasome regulatory subunit
MAAKFHIPSPDHNQRKHILDLTLRNEVVASDFNLDKLAFLTDGFSGSDLKEVDKIKNNFGKFF